MKRFLFPLVSCQNLSFIFNQENGTCVQRPASFHQCKAKLCYKYLIKSQSTGIKQMMEEPAGVLSHHCQFLQNGLWNAKCSAGDLQTRGIWLTKFIVLMPLGNYFTNVLTIHSQITLGGLQYKFINRGGEIRKQMHLKPATCNPQHSRK